MAEFDDEGNPIEESEGFKSLRKDRDEKAKKLADLEARLAEFEKRESRSKLESVISGKGFNPAVAKFYSGDDASEEAVVKWLEENKELFGVAAAPEGEQGGDTEVSEAEQQSTTRMSQLGTASTTGTPSVEDEIKNTESLDDLMKVLSANGMNQTYVVAPGGR